MLENDSTRHRTYYTIIIAFTAVPYNFVQHYAFFKFPNNILIVLSVG